MKNKTGRKIILIIAALIIIGIAIAVFCVSNHNAKYISKAEALDIAVRESALSDSVILGTEVDFDKGNMNSVYEVELETAGGKYEYTINAVTGEILFSQYEAED